jgi:hypothetical protein
MNAPMRRGTVLGGMLGALALTGGLAGCSGLDDFSFRKFNLKETLYPPEPMWVIKNSQEGDARAKALRSLKEPTQTGGTPEQQEAIMAVLLYSASSEPNALCRMAAVDALRKFKDPRAVEGIKDAYYKAGTFGPETAGVLRCQALQALGETGNPAAVDTLVRVLREPPVEGPEVDRQQKLDERIAAARALGHFNQYQANAALVEVLRTEPDVALRSRAHESLQAATGKHLAPDAQAWGDVLHGRNPPETATVSGPGIGERVLELTGLR